MSWLYESRLIPSEINGEIRCERRFGHWSVVVGGTGQDTPYLKNMWAWALRQITPGSAKIHRILILGLGAGGGLLPFYRQFPHAHIVCVEIDPAMVELASTLKLLRPTMRPEIHVGDALDILPTLTGRFDMIVCDMFLGQEVAPVTAQPKLIEQITRLLEPQGHLLVNAYTQNEILDSYKTAFAEEKCKKFHQNWMGFFRPHGSGILGDVWPDEFISFMTCPEYLQREYGDRPGFSLVQNRSSWSTRQNIGPLILEHSYGPQEPTLIPGPWRIHKWDSYTLKHPPAGWFVAPGSPWRRRTGYASIPATGDVHLDWSDLAKRERKKWLAQEQLEIIELDPETYCQFYARCDKSTAIIAGFTASIKRKAIAHKEYLHLYGVVRRGTTDVIAGLAILDIPEIRTSLHISGFMLDAARQTPSNTGLIAHWFMTSQARGIRVCDFDGFYAKGDATSWKGFSRFKSQFGTRFISYQKAFFCIARKKQ
jgi:SAM-dependent methyltransferase